METLPHTRSITGLRFFEDMALVAGSDGSSETLVISGKCCLELRGGDGYGTIVKVIEMDDNITAIQASRLGDYLLVNVSMSKPRVELISFKEAAWGTSLQKYRGHEQSTYILRAQFGGYQENFVICGSEDNSIYIWQRDSGKLLTKIKGHY